MFRALPKKLSLENHVMLRVDDGVVYFYLFLLIIQCVSPETNDKLCVKRETGEEKDNCSDLASLRRAFSCSFARTCANV